MIHYLVRSGYALQEVYGMTLGQLDLYLATAIADEQQRPRLF